jgi:hypothetical protein
LCSVFPMRQNNGVVKFIRKYALGVLDMRPNKNKRMKIAGESLEEMLRRIAPFLPKPPKIEKEEPKKWEFKVEGVVPWPPSAEAECKKKKSSDCCEIL